MQSEGETLDLLLATHFPDSDVVEGGGVPTVPHVDWQVAAKIITYRRVEWAIGSFAPHKSLGMDGSCGVAGLVCWLIPTRPDLLHSPERGNLRGSSSPVCLARPYNAPCRSSIWE